MFRPLGCVNTGTMWRGRTDEPTDQGGHACERTSWSERPFLTTSSRTKPESSGNSLSFRAATQWCSISHGGRTTRRSIGFLRNLVESYPEFRVAYTRLVVICTDNPLNLNEFRDSVGALWPFLGDPERTVQQDLGIEEFTDPHNPMIPHTFVLEPGLRIFKIYNGYWYWGRPTMHELHVDLRAVLQKTRPDFDLGAPGLREAWDRGDRDMFLVDTLDPPIRFTEGDTIGIKPAVGIRAPRAPPAVRRTVCGSQPWRRWRMRPQSVPSTRGGSPALDHALVMVRPGIGSASLVANRAHRTGHRSTGSRGSRPRLRTP